MRTKTGYMCGTDFEDEIEGHDAKVYVSVTLLKKKRQCWEECGIVKVSVEKIEEIYRPKKK